MGDVEGQEIFSINQLITLSFISYFCSDRLKNLPEYHVVHNGHQIENLKDCNNQAFVDGSVEVLPPESALINFAEIDAVIISNYTNMLALPYVTESTGFKGVVFATDPTLQFCRLLMEELVEYSDKVPKPPADQKWKTPAVFRQFYNLAEPNPQQWKPLYTNQDIQNCLAKVRPVSFHETVDLQNLLRVTPVSSGYAIGSCNWILETDYEKFVYLSNSSVLTTHPKALDSVALKDADVLFLTNLSQTPSQNPDSMLMEFCRSVVAAVKSGGNVLVPLYSMGLLYDLLEFLSLHLDGVNLSDIPIYILSHSAESSLALAIIYAEWLADLKQAKVFLPEEPFIHGFLIKNGRVKIFQAAHAGLSADFRTPCIVFASHPSLRLGDSVHFMELWGSDSKNVVILTEPDFYSPEVLAPFQPLAMKVLICPIDTSLSFAQANNLLNEIKPKSVYLHETYLKKATTPGDAQNFADSSVCYLAASMNLQKFESGGPMVSAVRGILSVYSNKLELEEPSEDAARSFPPPSTYGHLNLQECCKEMKKIGYDPQLIKKDNFSSSICLENEKVNIHVKPNETHIIFDSNDEQTRKKVRDTVVHCLCKI